MSVRDLAKETGGRVIVAVFSGLFLKAYGIGMQPAAALWLRKMTPSTWAPECVVFICSTNRTGTIANPCVCVCACANYISEPDH